LEATTYQEVAMNRRTALALALLASTTAVAQADQPEPATPLAAEPDNGFVTEIHKAHPGQIVFARSAAAVTTPEKADQFTEAFRSGEPIFFRAYLPSSLNNAFRAQGVQCADPFRIWSLSVDGTPIGRDAKDPYFFWEPLDQNAFTKSTSVRFDKDLTAAPDGDRAIWNAFHQVVAPKLTVGEHTLQLAVRGSCDDIAQGHRTPTYLATDLAVGTFKLTVAKGATVDPLPKAARKDAKLEQEAAKLLAAEWREDKILKVIVVEKDWTKQFEKILGRQVLQRRTIATVVAVQQRSGCRLFDVTFEQAARGKGFGPTARAGTGDAREIACEALK
jgi:hypothetical protein